MSSLCPRAAVASYPFEAQNTTRPRIRSLALLGSLLRLRFYTHPNNWYKHFAAKRRITYLSVNYMYRIVAQLSILRDGNILTVKQELLITQFVYIPYQHILIGISSF